MPLLRRHIREERSINESNQHNQYGPSLESSLAPALILAPTPPPNPPTRTKTTALLSAFLFFVVWERSRIGPVLADVHGRDGRWAVICPDLDRREERGKWPCWTCSELPCTPALLLSFVYPYESLITNEIFLISASSRKLWDKVKSNLTCFPFSGLKVINNVSNCAQIWQNYNERSQYKLKQFSSNDLSSYTLRKKRKKGSMGFYP